jgi:GT2 family glycosyltransferase
MTLSIGITTRNRPDALRACLESLAVLAPMQPEVLVFDDGSEPPAQETVGEAGKHVRFLRGPTGTSAGRNRLVQEASNEIVLLLDDDTRVLTAESIERGMRIMHDDPAVGAVAFAQANDDGRPWPPSMQPSSAVAPAVITAFIGFAHLVRRSTFLALGGYRELFEYMGEEKEYCLRLVDAGMKTVYLPDAYVVHRRDPGARDSRRYLRLVSRNDCLNSLYNDPLLRLVWTVPGRFMLYFRMRRGWKIHDPGGPWWLVREIVTKLPAVWRDRRPVSRATLARWRELKSGQVPYHGVR